MVDLLPHERQVTSSPDTTFRPQVSPGMFGGATAQATEQLGGAIAAVGHHWGDIVANDAVNQYQTEVGKLVNGDPEKQTVGPDGSVQADLGYLGTRGRAALDQRPAVAKKLDEITKRYMGGLYTADQKSLFDTASRRYRAIVDGTMGRHADQQGVVYATGTADAQAKIAAASIASNADNAELVAHGASDLIDAHVKKAMVLGAQPGDPQWIAARDQGKREAIATQASAIAVNDPQRAMRIIENNKDSLGLIYDDLANKFRARAEQAQGRDTADGLLSGSAPPAGDDAKAVLRHFEGFREKPYKDTDGRLRVGYGSDTVTKADGSIVPVTGDTVVTREDAERDLARRAADSQKAVRDKVGEKFDSLTPEAKASLTSIAYNYGSGNIPQTVVDAAKTGDPTKIAQAIRGLAGHNNGINAGRRASEANNVAPGDAVPRSQSDLINDVVSRNLPPQAEAAAIARINKSYALQHQTEVRTQAALDLRAKNATAEALNTGEVTAPIPKSDFIKVHGVEKGTERYEAYQSDVQFGVDRKSMEELSDTGITQLVNSRGPQPGDPAYARKLENVVRLTKAADQVQKQRAEDPAGSVDRTPAVKEAFKFYDPKKPESFQPVIAARLASQERLEIPTEAQTAISENEAKHYAATLKPIAKEGVPPQNQEDVINGVVEGVKAKYGDHAQEAMSRILYHVTLKKDASEVLAAALTRNARGEEPRITQTEAQRIQIERDAERAAQISAQVKPSISGGAVGGGVGGALSSGKPAAPFDVNNLSPQAVGDVVNQANQKTQKPFNEAVDMLRSDPSKYMPYFVKKFGVAKVPPDLQQYLPKPKVGDNGG